MRWEVKLSFPVTEVVHGVDSAAWKAFEDAIFEWCSAVRKELTEEWLTEKMAEKRPPPELKVEVPEGSVAGDEDVAVLDDEVDVREVDTSQNRVPVLAENTPSLAVVDPCTDALDGKEENK